MYTYLKHFIRDLSLKFICKITMPQLYIAILVYKVHLWNLSKTPESCLAFMSVILRKI